jgi:hypothetical protein
MILNTTQARMVACSLEIDGRADIAAQAITPRPRLGVHLPAR